ncbi:hypothetical protein GCM10027612_21200 [Microbispora bryophytorum subsp. camponoti]
MAAKAHRRPAVRRAPVPVLAVTGLCAVGYQAAGFDVPAVAYLFAVYAAMRAGHRVITVAASVTMPAALPRGHGRGPARYGRDALLAPSVTRRLIDRFVTQPLHTGAEVELEEPTTAW